MSWNERSLTRVPLTDETSARIKARGFTVSPSCISLLLPHPISHSSRPRSKHHSSDTPLASMFRSLYTQWFPPKPTLTEENVPSQQGRVFIVTGGNAGVGFELCRILYGTGATIYMASRSEVSLPSQRPHPTNIRVRPAPVRQFRR